jgi:aminoglycoside phosphotransferase (APT) family kinase protein
VSGTLSSTTAVETGVIDGARPVRAGEEVDANALFEALRVPLGEALGGALEGPPVVKQFPSGHSNLTYSLEVKISGKDAPVDLVMRRPPFGNKVKTAHDMGREVRILGALSRHGYDKAPRPLVYVEDESVIGAPFYVMNRISGVVLRRKVPSGIDLGSARVAELSDSFIRGLVELHALPWRDFGLAEFGKPEGYVARQVRGWAKRYEDAKTDDIPSVEEVSAWLLANLPRAVEERERATIVHNDFKYDNLVLDPAELGIQSAGRGSPARPRILGVLDWEMATIGDPLTDLATTLAYWIEAGDPEPLKAFAFGPTYLPGSPKRHELLDRYVALSGRDASNIAFYYAFALFKNAVVAQQIYTRFKKGLTKDERFGMFIVGVQLLGAAALAAIRTGSIDPA